MDDAEIAAMWACRDLALEMQHAPQPTPTNRVPVRCDHSNNRFDREQGCVVCVRCGVILIPQIFTDAYNNLTFTGDKCGKVSMYKRKHHFNERIAQWTVARERVPDEVVAEVKRRIKGTVTKTAIRAAWTTGRGARAHYDRPMPRRARSMRSPRIPPCRRARWRDGSRGGATSARGG